MRTNRRRRSSFLVGLAILVVPAALGLVRAFPEAPAIPAPPVAEKVRRTTQIHGDVLQDDYYWLRERTDPAVVKYLEAENAYAEQMMAPARPLREALYKEMLGRIKQTDVAVPYKEGGYFYYHRTEEGRQYKIYCRRKGTMDAAEQVILDLNLLAEGQQFMGLGGQAVSDDGNFLAYSTDNTGFRVYKLFFKDLRDGRVLPETRDDVDSVAWASDSRTLFYTTKDAAKRPYRLWRHVLGSEKDDLIYEEKDELFRIEVSRTRSKAYVLMYSNSLTTTEARYIRSGEPGSEWKTIAPRRHEREYDLDHHGDVFYIRVNDTGRNFRLVSAPAVDPGETNWKEVRPHKADVMLEEVDCFDRFLVLWERRDGLPVIEVTELESGRTHEVAFPEPAYSVYGSENPEYASTRLRYAYQSLVTPASVYDYDMGSRKSELLKRVEVLGEYHPEDYVSERVHATAKDGTRIPVSIVRRKEVRKDGRAPIFLTGYGAYGYPNSVRFDSDRLSLLDRGVVFAIAHIRGGGEMGKAWHDQGRMRRKMNTFNDFIAAAEFLLEQKYGSKDRLVIEGGSAGGLLMGAVTNMRPDLFKAVINLVPFVDVINTMSDPSLPLTVQEFEEWGNPAEKGDYEYIRQYCPYTNIAPKPYPAILVRTSFNDSQVMYWEPAKYVARLRALKTDDNPLLLVTNMAGGHGGSSGRYDKLREIAFDHAFALTQMGIVK